jgi:hypothetical protein
MPRRSCIPDAGLHFVRSIAFAHAVRFNVFATALFAYQQNADIRGKHYPTFFP